jgi:HEAT repeat protein
MMKTVILRMTPLALLLAGIAPTCPAAAIQPGTRSQAAGEVAADRLTAIGTAHAITLADAIRTGSWSGRRLEGGGLFRAPGAAGALTLALGDPRPVVRRLAAWGLSELRATEAQHRVAPLLRDEAPEVRGEAARALADIGAHSYSAQVAALIADPSGGVRLQAAHALGDFQNPATRPALQAALRDPEPEVRAKARWALGRVSEAETALRRSRAR